MAFYLDRQALLALGAARHESYDSADPFPHTVFDDFLPPSVLEEVLAEFPAPGEGSWLTFDSGTERKLASPDESSMGPATRHLLAQLNSATAIDFLEALTGIHGLVPDPHYFGGGMHQIEPGGFLEVHADFNLHPRTKLERRLNLLIYLNEDWSPDYGGALELWDRDMQSCRASVAPIFNRCVVFSTTSTSYHGHPHPLACPPGRTRKSLALYYYSRSEAPVQPHNTLWLDRSGDQPAGLLTRLKAVRRRR